MYFLVGVFAYRRVFFVHSRTVLVGDDAGAVHVDDEIVIEPSYFAGVDELDHALVFASVHFEADAVPRLQFAFECDVSHEEWDALDVGGRCGRVVARRHQAGAFIAPGEFLHVVA